ncbi:MAG: response regulator [Terriglobales bacterium]
MGAAVQPHILLVDDEVPILMTYRIIFERQGYRVTAVRSSGEALEAMDHNHFDLLICDLALDGSESGLDLVRAARQRESPLPCILLTGYPDPHLPEGARHKGVQVLFKPVDVPHVLSTVDRLLRRQEENPDSRPAS